MESNFSARTWRCRFSIFSLEHRTRTLSGLKRLPAFQTREHAWKQSQRRCRGSISCSLGRTTRSSQRQKRKRKSVQRWTLRLTLPSLICKRQGARGQPLSSRVGFTKNSQLFLRDLKLSQAAVRTDKHLRKNPNDQVLKALQSRKMNSNLASELAFLT